MMDDFDDELKEFIKKENEKLVTLPRRPDKVVLTEEQKNIVKAWVRPMATTTHKCSRCGGFFSSGYLNICSADNAKFCSKNVLTTQQKPTGFTDAELGFYFGLDRSDLD